MRLILTKIFAHGYISAFPKKITPQQTQFTHRWGKEFFYSYPLRIQIMFTNLKRPPPR